MVSKVIKTISVDFEVAEYMERCDNASALVNEFFRKLMEENGRDKI